MTSLSPEDKLHRQKIRADIHHLLEITANYDQLSREFRKAAGRFLSEFLSRDSPRSLSERNLPNHRDTGKHVTELAKGGLRTSDVEGIAAVLEKWDRITCQEYT